MEVEKTARLTEIIANRPMTAMRVRPASGPERTLGLAEKVKSLQGCP
jgi:hypothetical protein